MFVRKLLDPEEVRRRKHLRARILRRNRIKKEVTRGLEPKLHRVPYQPKHREPSEDGWQETANSMFVPTFGGNSDQNERLQDRYVAGTLRTSYHPAVRTESPVPKQTTTRKKQLHAADEHSADDRIPAASTYGKDVSAVPPGPSQEPKVSTLPLAQVSPPVVAPTKRMISKAKARWHDTFQQVIFNRHSEILAKDPNRRWRQERFGLLLFEKKDYAKAAKHLTLAIALGASSSVCWRRLAQCHFYVWEEKGEWDSLWDSKGAYEQAMNHLEIACNPYALFEYARVLEVLGIFTGALSVCASILQTFPRFRLLHKVMFRFVLLQRYQTFASAPLAGSAVPLGSMEAIEKESMLIKCVGYTNTLLLEKQIAEDELYVSVLYMHARLNELLAVSTTAAGGGATAAKAAQSNADRSFEELFKIAIARTFVAPSPGLTWKAWITKSDTYIAWAGYFHDRNETIPATDALSKALDLLEAPLVRAATDARLDTSEQSRSKLSLYLALGRTYYQCNQMERAIRSMETVFQMDRYHEEARASLAAWFPAKWKYRLDLEDASQIQIARVVRGIWGRNTALRRRQELQRMMEQKYIENPYHPLHRRNVLRVLRSKYAPVFLAQDISARRIQASARRYLYYARIRWSLSDQRAKFIQQLKSKQQTRKYRFNRHIRKQLAQLLPDEYEDQFHQEDHAALFIQRHVRGDRVRRAYRSQRDAHRTKIRQQSDAGSCIQRFFRRYCRHQSANILSAEELLFRAQLKIAQAKECIARNLQRLYRRWKSSSESLPSFFFQASQRNAEKEGLRRQTCSVRIQRAWRRYVVVKELGHRSEDSAKVLVQQLKRGHKRQSMYGADLELAARKIQALYRGKRIRNSLCKIRRVFAPLSLSPIAALLERCETNQREGVESCVTLRALDSLEEKRALFDHPAVILQPPETDTRKCEDNRFPLQHLASAVEHSALLRCLICTSGNFQDDRIEPLLCSLQKSRALRVLALGRIQTTSDVTRKSSHHSEHPHAAPEHDDGDPADSESSRETLAEASSQRRRTHTTLQLLKRSPMKLLSQALRTRNFLLEELYLEDNLLLENPVEGSQIADFLGDFFFARYGRLKKLVLAKMRFSDGNAGLLGNALSINTVLQHLDLHGNHIGDDGASAIAKHGLAHNTSLLYLNLAENAIGSPGAKALFECLATQNHTLETLILCNNNILNDSIAAVSTAWQSNPTVLQIDLRGNLIHSDHLRNLGAAVEERRMSSTDPELRLFLARKRFSLDMLAKSPSSRAHSPLKSMGSSKRTKRLPAKAALSPKAWLRQAQNDHRFAGTAAGTTMIKPPIAVYRQHHKEYGYHGADIAPTASVLALVSPARASKARKKKPAAPHPYATKLPAISANSILVKEL